MTEEEICDIINHSYLKINESTYNGEIKMVDIKIPVYNSKVKKCLVSILFFLLKRKSRALDIDFSKFISPDEWIIYKENIHNIPLIAIPESILYHKNSWEINLVPEFFKEDLRYGVNPITIYNYIPSIGLGPIIWGKKSNKFHQLGSVHWVYHDFLEEYDNFINNKETGFSWDELEIDIN